VARIPRVAGSGTSRSGQGAFGNMCRKGRMYAPTKIWRRWHRHVNVGQRRFAVVSALAASAVPALVQARGHRIDGLEEVPLVVSTALAAAAKNSTKSATAILKALGAYADVERVVDSKKLRAGRGKGRNRRFTQRLGPLVVCGAEDEEGVARGFRNIPGVSVSNVDRLNLLQLAPGGHLGRFIIWTQSAFSRLEGLFGAVGGTAPLKNGFSLPRAPVANADLARLINSAEIQAVVRPALLGKSRHARQKKNPLRNFKAMLKLNPYAATIRKAEAARKAAKKVGGTRKDKARRIASRKQFKSITAEEFAPVA